MWCPRCGSQTEDQAKFCSACGMDLSTYQRLWQDQGAQAAYGQPEAPKPAPTPQPQQTSPSPPEQTPTLQPAVPQGQRPQIPNYLGWSIAVLILCFWPTAIPAIINSTQVDSRLARGDVDGAWEASRKAKMWCWISFAIGVVLLGIVLAANY